MKKIGFIDYYLDEWHANNYPTWIKEASGGELEVAYAYGMITSPISGMTTEQWCEKFGVARCYSIEELVEKSDCIIVLSPDNCEMHEGLCQLPLRSGKPTYIDKTFAPDYDVAKRIFAIAEQHNTSCYSTSALRYATEYKEVNREKITAISSWGPNDFNTYSIHQLEPIMMLMQTAVQRVMYVPSNEWYTVLLEFVDGRQATLTGFGKGSPFMMNIASEDCAQVVKVESDFFHEFIVDLCDFFCNPVIKVPHEETLSIMAVRSAVLRAQKVPGQWVDM